MNNIFLDRISQFEPGDFPFISVYLNTETNENGQRDFDSFLKKQLSEHEDKYESGTSNRESYDSDVLKIEEFVSKIEPSTSGVAVFASTGREDFFEAFEFEVPFDDNHFFVLEKPRIYPLVRLISQNPMFAVVSADTNSANIYVFKRGKTIEREEIGGTKTNRSEVRGWSQMRYQRHIENFHQQHAKKVITELENIVRDEKIDRIILAGDQAVIIPILREEMSKELNEKVIEVLSLNVNTPEHELLDAAMQAVQKNDTVVDKEKIDYLLEHNYDEGVGVAGFAKTLTALLNGQVQELYITSDIEDITYNTGQINKILKDYAPGEDGDMPDPHRHTLLIDELLVRAAESADEIRFIEDPELLKEAGGVGAILRYQAKVVSNP